MTSLKIVLKLFLVFACLGIAIKGWHLLTDGFRLDKIEDNLNFEDFEISSKDFDELRPILNQKFKYLAKGCQAYVFESEDKKYVLKFIRYHRYRLPLWLKQLSFLSYYQNKRSTYKSKLLNEALSSYKIAYSLLKDETKTLFVHLNKTDFINQSVTIIDRLNTKHVVDLDETGFMIQRKSQLLEKVLLKNISNEKELKKLTSSFLKTTISIYKKNVINDDYNCIKNCGVIDDQVIHMDLGSFVIKNELSRQDFFDAELNRFLKHYNKWSKKNAGILIPFVDEEIRNIVSNLD